MTTRLCGVCGEEAPEFRMPFICEHPLCAACDEASSTTSCWTGCGATTPGKHRAQLVTCAGGGACYGIVVTRQAPRSRRFCKNALNCPQHGSANDARPQASAAGAAATPHAIKAWAHAEDTDTDEVTDWDAPPSLRLPPFLLAFVPRVSLCCDHVDQVTVSSGVLALELIRFLRIKLHMHDVGGHPALAPSARIEAAWQMLLWDTKLLDELHMAMGQDEYESYAGEVMTAEDKRYLCITHPHDDGTTQADALAVRQLATLAAALHLSERGAPGEGLDGVGTCRLPQLHKRVWGTPPASYWCVRVILPAGDQPLRGRVVLHAFMPPDATLSCVDSELDRVYCYSIGDFRARLDADILLDDTPLAAIAEGQPESDRTLHLHASYC